MEVTPVQNDVGVTSAPQHRIALTGIEKRFGPTRAVADVEVSFDSTQITAIMGGNGAGKSTLMKVLAGEVRPDEGELALDGTVIDWVKHSPRAAHADGIRVVHQELSLAESLSVAENFFIEHRSAGRGSWQKHARETAREAIVRCFGENTGIRPGDIVSTLSVAQRQIVEISRAASAPNLRVLILDEPTSAMGREYLPHMRALVRRLRDAGVIVLVITHKMYELPALADRVVVLREGELVADLSIEQADEDTIISLMTGASDNSVAAGRRSGEPGEPAIVVTGIAGELQDVELTVRRGEVVGLAGLQGGGQTEVLRAVLGGNQAGLEVHGTVAYVTGDRKDEGVFPLWSSRLNLAIATLASKFPRRPFRGAAVDEIAQPWLDRLRLPAEAGDKQITSLSGGMQQKILIARALASDADILLLNDPTRGVDVHTKRELYSLIHDAADRGLAVLWASSEDLEAAQCDRVYVMADKAVVSEVTGERAAQGGLVADSFTDVVKVVAPEKAEHRAVAGLRSVVRRPWVLAAVGLLLTGVIIVARQPVVASYVGLELVLSLAPVLAIAGLAQMFVITLGDIDLGLGAYLGYVGVVAATALYDAPFLGLILLVAGILVYPLVGYLITARNVPAIVATLGMSFVWLGLALTVQPSVGGTVPEWLVKLSSFSTPILPLPVFILIVAALIGWFIVRRSRLGALMRGVGSNPVAVAHAGWNILTIRMAAYTLAGVSGAVAGLLFAAVASSGDAHGTSGYTLTAIAAAIIGGCAFSGGRVSPVGVVVAGTMLTLVAILLSALSVPPVFTAAAQGLLLLIVMGLRRIPALRPEES